MNARSGRTYYALTSGARPGGVGEITNGLYWPNGDVAVAPTDANIIEPAAGSYVATRTAPTITETTSYIITWYDPTTDESNTEELVVSGMGASGDEVYYASPDEVRTHLRVTEDQMSDDLLIGPIQRAQDDIDAACGSLIVYADTGLKFATATVDPVLTDREALLLSKATCYQVEYRLTVGDDFMVREQYEARSGPGYGTTGILKKVCGAAYTKLGQAGLLRLSGRVSNRSALSNALPRIN